MAQDVPYEIPQHLREIGERRVDQARMTCIQFIDAMAEASSTWISAMPSNDMLSGFRVLQERVLRFTKQNTEAGFAMSSELVGAKNIQDLLAIQSRYAQTQTQIYVLQAQELGRLMVEAVQSIQPTKLTSTAEAQ
jgi:hypothetical protein